MGNTPKPPKPNTNGTKKRKQDHTHRFNRRYSEITGRTSFTCIAGGGCTYAYEEDGDKT